MANSVIYRRLMVKQGHGLPFWQPEPDANLDKEYTEQGISIGDLGILTEDGGFECLFNIHANPLAVSQSPTPPLPPLDRTDIRKIPNFHPEDACMTHNADYSLQGTFKAGVEVVPAAGPSLEVGFTITQTKAAMLVLPHGADRYELKAYDKYEHYAAKHGKSWYEYLNGVQQRRVRNGSLYLVTGCDKARSWGLAAGSPHQERRLTFSIGASPVVVPASGAVSFSASWRNATGVGSRHYPSSTTAITEDKNQCVFARGFVIGIKEKFFSKASGVALTDATGYSPRSLPHIHRDVPFQLPPGTNAPPTPQRAANQFSRGNSQDQERDTIHSDTTPGVIVRDHPTPMLSPGSYICEHLLSSQPDIDVAVVHDNDWIAATSESSDAENIFTPDGMNYERLTACVLDKCRLKVTQGAAVLRVISSKRPEEEA